MPPPRIAESMISSRTRSAVLRLTSPIAPPRRNLGLVLGLDFRTMRARAFLVADAQGDGLPPGGESPGTEAAGVDEPVGTCAGVHGRASRASRPARRMA